MRGGVRTATPDAFRPRVGVLPAFGAFTGAATVPIRRGDRVLADGEVIDVTRS